MDSEETTAIGQNRVNKKLWRFLLVILIVFVAVGLYLLKNPIGTPAETTLDDPDAAQFALDATHAFDLDTILAHGLPVIVDFGADSCEPCKDMAPILVELNQELRGKAVIKLVDVWKDSEAAANLPLQVIPTQFFFLADGSPYVPADEEAAAKNGFILYELSATGEHVYTVHQGGLDKAELLAILAEMGMK